MKQHVSIAVAVVTLLAMPAATHAEGDRFAEFVGGVMMPLGESDYEDFIDPSLKLGVRLSFFGDAVSPDKMGLGVELGLDWTPASNDLDDSPTIDASFNRLRGIVALRARKRIGKKTIVFMRAGGGIDYVIGSIEGTVIFPVNVDDNDLGLAFEVGGGVVTRVGGGFVGVQAALPIAIHFGDEEELDYDYTGYDLDILFTAGSTF